MAQMTCIEVDTHDFPLKRRAIVGVFTLQDNGFPYRLWTMSIWVSSNDYAHGTP